MHKQRLGGLISGLITVGGILLPWVSNVPVVSNASGTSYLLGWVLIFLVGFSLFQHLAGDDKTAPKNLAFIGGIVSGSAAIVIAIMKIIGFSREISGMINAYPLCEGWAKDIHFGFGLYLVIIGGAAQVLSAIFLRDKSVAGKNPE